MYVHTCMCVCVCECGCTRMCMCARVGVKHVFIFICMCWLRVTASRTHSVRSGPVARDSDLCPLWTRYDGDSKTDIWDDP